MLQRRVNSAATIETRHGYDPRIIYTGFRRGERRRARVRELHPLPATLRDRQTLENRFISSGGWVNASGGDSKRLGPVSNIYTRYTRFLLAWQGKIEREGKGGREKERGWWSYGIGSALCLFRRHYHEVPPRSLPCICATLGPRVPWKQLI